TVKGAVTGGTGDDAARFYAGEAAKVLQGYFHAAALAGHTLDTVLDWVADPRATTVPEEILRTDPRAAEHWDGLLRGALRGDERTSSNTITTVQQALNLYFQPSIRARCVPSAARPATNLRDLIAANGTIYMLGREDPYASASPLMTAVAEDVLDTALALAYESKHLRLTPAFVSVLDELPSTTPLPTLATRMANERANGMCFIWASQTERQMTMVYGKDQAAAIRGLTNVLTIFGGSKDVDFIKDISALLDTERVLRRSRSRQGLLSTSSSVTDSYEDVPVLRPGQIRKIATGHALVIAENAPPIIARLDRCITSRTGHVLLTQQKILTRLVDDTRRTHHTATSRDHPARPSTTTPVAPPASPTPTRPTPAPAAPHTTPAPAPPVTTGMAGTDAMWGLQLPELTTDGWEPPGLHLADAPTTPTATRPETTPTTSPWAGSDPAPDVETTQAIPVSFIDQYRSRPRTTTPGDNR
ncbi:type IV secretory system conjugative DNA transfer family protein, partial [Corynebacterium variabile]|uniref:type IV secretory system conjugative DNA transfer family protein n=1 Tax=Corynebacterium variabile TaxID=1727 RepID=UPI002FE3D169